MNENMNKYLNLNLFQIMNNVNLWLHDIKEKIRISSVYLEIKLTI